MAVSKTIVTDIGKAKLAQAAATGTTVKLKYFAVGDGNGSEYTPTGKEDKLLGENWRSAIGSISVSKTDPKELFVDTVVPENVGGWWIREYGVFDEDNSLILIGTINEVYKAKLEEGDIVAFDFNLSLTLQNVSNVEYVIDLASYVPYNFLLRGDYEVTGQVDHGKRIRITSESGDNRTAVVQDILNLYKISVSVLPATEILGTSLRANGSLDALGISTNIVQAGFEYRLTGSQTWQRSTLSDMTATGSFTGVISGLIKNTTYDLRAIGINKQHSDNVGYSEIINVTTANLNPQVDSVINITGTTDSSSSSALTTATVPDISNGHIVAGAAIADADNCISQTLEVAQPASKSDLIGIQATFALNPRKLNVLPETTKDSIVLSSPIAGLLTNGSSLWADDGGAMKDVTVDSVTQETIGELGINWTNYPINGSPALQASVYGNGVYVAVGSNGAIYTSFDAQNWTDRGIINTASFSNIIFANGQFLAIGPSTFYTSTDGITWVNKFSTLPAPVDATTQLTGIAYGNGVYVIVGTRTSGGQQYILLSSSDLNTWTSRSATGYSANRMESVIFANNLFMIGGNGSICTSTNGITWQSFVIDGGNSRLATGAAWNGTIWVLATWEPGGSPTYRIYTSSNNGNAWVLRQAQTGISSNVVWDGANFVTCGYWTSFNFILTSLDGITWTNQISGNTLPLHNINYANNQLIIMGDTGTVLLSADICKYTCTGITPALSNIPTAIYKAGQKFATSVSKTAGTSSYVATTTDNVVRVDDTLIMSMKQQDVTGRYTRLQASINNGDQIVRYAADLYINQTTPRSEGHYLPCGIEVLKPNEHLGYSDDDIAAFESRHKQEQQASLADIARELLNESQLYAHDHSLTKAQKEELSAYNGDLILVIRGELDVLPSEPVWFYL